VNFERSLQTTTLPSEQKKSAAGPVMRHRDSTSKENQAKTCGSGATRGCLSCFDFFSDIANREGSNRLRGFRFHEPRSPPAS